MSPAGSPERLTQARFIDTFEQFNGVHPGFRRNHAKGICVAGSFESNGQGVRCPRPPCSRPAACPSSAVSRLPAAILSGRPNGRARLGPELPPARRAGMADGDDRHSRLPGQRPQGLLRHARDAPTPTPASRPGGDGGVPRRPSGIPPAIQVIMGTLPSGFANASYNGLNAFRFVDASGTATPVRWSMPPASRARRSRPPRRRRPTRTPVRRPLARGAPSRCNGIS